MRGKLLIITLILTVGIFTLSGAIFLFSGLRSSAIHNGSLDLSGWDGKRPVALTGKAAFYRGTEPEEPVYFPLSRTRGLIGEITGCVGYNVCRIQVTGVSPGQRFALRLPPDLAACLTGIDGGTMQSEEDTNAPRYGVKTLVFISEHDTFDIVLQRSGSEILFGGAGLPAYLGTVDQIGKLNSLVNGIDVSVIFFILIVISYNIFYIFLRRDMFFAVFILLCIMIIGRTMVGGSFFMGSLFPDAGPAAARNIDCLTMFFISAVWLSVTYFSNTVTLPKNVIEMNLCYAVIASAALFMVPPPALTLLYALSEFIWIVTAFYILLKSVEAVLVQKLNRARTFLLLSGVLIMVFCSVLDLYRDLFVGRWLMDFLPVGLIAYTLLWDYSYTYQYNALLQDRVKVLEDLKTAYENGRLLELKFLRSQIRPHFINNVLNAIIAVSLTDPEQSRVLLCHFSTYLKSCYDIGETVASVPLENELSVVKAYIALEEARFADALQVEYRIDITDIDIPPLILQPLAENAIKHNRISYKAPLSVCIYAVRDGESVKIGVSDNGQGFDPAMIPVLLSEEQSGNGVGIYNVNTRLRRLYGTTLIIENRAGGGCDVYMLLPVKPAPKPDEGGLGASGLSRSQAEPVFRR